MPWVPELFTAPALQRILEKRRRDALVAVPYFDGLLAGDPDPLVESFAVQPEVHDPVRGRIKGEAAFRAFVTETSAWLRQHHASVEDVEHVILERRGFEEVVAPPRHRRRHASTCPSPSSPIAGSTGASTRCGSTSALEPLTGRHANRPPLLQPDPELPVSDAVAAYVRALRCRGRRRDRRGLRAGRLCPRAGGRPATSTAARTACVASTSGCSATAAASRWRPARSSTTAACAPWSTTSCGGERRARRCLRPGSRSSSAVGSGKLAAVRVYDDTEPPQRPEA